MEIMNYVIEKALILVPVLLIIGQMLKVIPKFPDWCIPWALLVVGVSGACMILGWTLEGVMQGILVAGAAVYGNQLYKQTKEHDRGKCPVSPADPDETMEE